MLDSSYQIDYFKIAKILDRVSNHLGIKVDCYASGTDLIVHSDCWETECLKLPELLRWFKKFYRHQNKHQEFLGL